MYTLKIKVTKEILEKSKYCGGNMGSCAIAQAVRDIFPTAIVGFVDMALFSPDIKEVGNEAWMDFWYKFKHEKPKDNHISVSEEMYQFISLFDRTPEEERPNLPEQEFEINLCDKVIEKINIEEIKSVLENHPTLQLTNA